MPGHWFAAADAWYTSATLWAIVAAVATLIGAVGTWVAVFISTPKRRLLFGIRIAAPIVTAPIELRNELKILDRGTRLREPWFVEIELVGRGRRDIPASLFEGQPIRLDVGGRIVRVLTVTSNELSRRPPTIDYEGTALLIRPSVIGRRQHIVIPLLTDGPRPTLSCQTPLSDVEVREAGGGELSKSRISRAGRVAATVSITVIFALAVQVLTPSGRQYVFGVDEPIELSPLCENLGGIVAPPAEIDAAFHYRCARSGRTITRAQIERRCKAQWGSNADLVLRDPNSASGWKCHTPGLLP
jgi:hypothetical protein